LYKKQNKPIYIILILAENISFNFLDGFKAIASTPMEPTQVIEISNSSGKHAM